MNRLLMSTAIVGLAALPSFAIAQSDQADDTMTQEQTETDSQVETGTSTDTEADSEAGSDSDMEDGAQSENESDMGGDSSMGGSDDPGGSDMESDSSMEGSSGTDDEAASDKGSGSDGMSSGDRPSATEGHSEVDPSTVEASEVEGAPVMSRDGEEIADVSEVLLTEDGSIDSLVVNVGGVLGIGSKPVEIPFDEVTLQTRDEDDEMSVVIPMSQKELEDMPEYEEG